MHSFFQAYVPDSIVPLLAVAAVAGISLAMGMYLPNGRRTRLTIPGVWLWLIGSVAVTHFALDHVPAGFRMLALVLVTLLGTKCLMHLDWIRQKKTGPLPPKRYAVFALGWLGMRPEPFAMRETTGLRASPLLLRGGICTGSGLLLLFLARLWDAGMATDVLLLAGLSFTLHFGLTTLSAGVFRMAGFRVGVLFRNPLMATTLTDFWTRYWNLGFVEMTARLVHRPFRNHFGKLGNKKSSIPALLAAFGFSGILHETAITLPVKSGFGLPMCYFLLHAIFVAIETVVPTVRPYLQAHPIIAPLWVATTLIVPLPLLFVRPFLDQVLRPLIGLGPGV